MSPSASTPGLRNLGAWWPRGATIATLSVLVVTLALPGKAGPVVLSLIGVGCAAIVLTSALWARGGGSSGVAWLATLSALALGGAVVDLTWIENGPATIPLAGVGILLLGFVGLVVSAFLLTDRRPGARPQPAQMSR